MRHARHEASPPPDSAFEDILEAMSGLGNKDRAFLRASLLARYDVSGNDARMGKNDT